MRSKDVKAVRLSPWPKGVNTRLEPHALPQGVLRAAVNVDLDSTGRPKRRAGYTRLLTGQAHSLWANDDYLLLVLDGDLVRVGLEGPTLTLIRRNVGAEPLSYARIANLLYYANRSVRGRLDLARFVHYSDFAPPNPEGSPALTATTAGMPAGTYQVALTYVSALGEESGAGLADTIELTDGQGIHLTDIPQGNAQRIRIYCSPPNGDKLFRQTEVGMGTTELILSSFTRGKQLSTQFLEPLPAGSLLRYFRGRLYCVDGPVIWYSQPIHYGLHAPDDDYLPPFSGDVTLLEPVEEGLFIGAGGTWFLHGSGPEDFVLRFIDAETPIPGTGLSVPVELIDSQQAGRAAYWMTPNGPALGLPNGLVKYPTRDNLPGFSAASGVSGLLRDGGVDRVVTCLNDASLRSTFGT